jgi:uncharacterized membrane protein (UPF0127 family)
VLTFIVACALAGAQQPVAPVAVMPDGTRVTLELATTEKERELGLMFRESLAPDHGMLFLFDKTAVHPFWMKYTFIPLDMVWLDAKGKVVDVRASVPPCRSDPCPSYSPRAPDSAVLEVNAGFAASHGVTVGTTLRFHDVPGYPPDAEGARR